MSESRAWFGFSSNCSPVTSLPKKSTAMIPSQTKGSIAMKLTIEGGMSLGSVLRFRPKPFSLLAKSDHASTRVAAMRSISTMAVTR